MQYLALAVTILFILWLFARDRKLRPMTSWALWIPLLWVTIIGSRALSYWVEGANVIDSPTDYLEGRPLDRNTFLLLMIAAAVVLYRRRLDWRSIVGRNRWFFALLFYCGISVLWSHDPFFGFKGWAKVIANVLMVLVVLTEDDPVSAFRALFSRMAALLIPLSVLFIYFFPEIGTYYNDWAGEVSYIGVTMGKNTLGITLVITGLFIAWDATEAVVAGGETDRLDLLSRGVLFGMILVMAVMARSSTSLICLLLGTILVISISLPVVKTQMRFLGLYTILLALLLLLFLPTLLESFANIVGKDTTMTGRTELWQDLLAVSINPLIGEGYHGFWNAAQLDYFWSIYPFRPTQAHNGYLQIYLDDGLLGLSLLLGMIVSLARRCKQGILSGSRLDILLFAYLVVGLFHNVTEATFCEVNLVWSVFCLGALYDRPLAEPAPVEESR